MKILGSYITDLCAIILAVIILNCYRTVDSVNIKKYNFPFTCLCCILIINATNLQGIYHMPYAYTEI